MEGTRHERIGIAIAAYIIGFTTAFIAFGVHRMDFDDTHVEMQHMTEINTTALNDPTIIQSYVETSDGFYAQIGNTQRLLSAKRDELGASVATSGEVDGFHTAVYGAAISSDGHLLYFCEQLSEADQTCVPYVFSMDEDSLYKVSLDGNVSRILSDSSTGYWTDNGYLTLGDYISASTDMPWKLVTLDAISQ